MEIEKLKEQLISDPEVRDLIARRAFEIYLERKGRRHAHPAEDWLRAESEIIPRLMHQMIERNRRAIESQDESDPVLREAAEHMQHELELSATEAGEPSDEAKAVHGELLNQNAASLASQRDEAGEDTVPNARGVLGDGEPTKKAGAKKAPAAKDAVKKAAAKPAAKKAVAKKAPAAKAGTDGAPAKSAPKKAAAATAPAKPPAKKAAARPVARKPAKPRESGE